MLISINTLGYSTASDCTMIQDKKLVKEINKADGFAFSVLPEDAIFSLIKTNKCSYITAYDDVENEVVFRGRVISANPESSDTTSAMSVTCEGPLGYLRDSCVFGVYVESTKEENGQTVENKVDARNVMSNFMTNHNNFVSDELKFNTSIIFYDDPTHESANPYILKKSHNFDGVTTMDAVLDLLDDLGYECLVTYQDTVPHWTLHVSPKFGYFAPDPIVTGLNLKSLSEDIDGSELVTSILPMGGVGYDEKKLMLGPISMGDELDYTPYMSPGAQGGDWYNESQAWYAKMYVDNDTLVRKWGRHIGVVDFDDIVANDVTEVKAKRIALRQKACENAAKLSDVEDEFNISAWDLYRAGYAIGALTLYNMYTVRDTNLDITVAARLTKQEFNYDNILESECTFTVKSDEESSVS